jgi:NAD(P)-dependent dehydrogenase (short-subunit alcohol dehydrogenase family)
VARDESKLKEVETAIKKINPSVHILTVSADISHEEAVRVLFSKISAAFGHADVLVNNAGIFKAIAPVQQVSSDAWWNEMVRLPVSLSR